MFITCKKRGRIWREHIAGELTKYLAGVVGDALQQPSAFFSVMVKCGVCGKYATGSARTPTAEELRLRKLWFRHRTNSDGSTPTGKTDRQMWRLRKLCHNHRNTVQYASVPLITDEGNWGVLNPWVIVWHLDVYVYTIRICLHIHSRERERERERERS